MKRDETIFMLEAWDGALVRVPLSQADEFLKKQEELKAAADKGQTPKAPAEFTQKMLELFEDQN